MSTSIIQQDRLWTGSFIKICLVNFFVFVSFHSFLPTFPFFVTHLGGDAVMIGVATALFSIAAIVSRPFAGWLVDTKGRCTLLMIGLIGLALLPMGYFVSTGIIVALFLRTIQGVFHATSSNAASTWAADIIPPRRMGEGLGMYGLSTALSTAMAPAAGLALMNALGFRPLFVATTIAALIAILLGSTIKNRNYKLSSKQLQVSQLFERMSLPAAFTQLFFMMTFGVVEVYVAFYANLHGLPGGGMYFIALAVATLFTRIFLGRTVDKYGEAWLIYTGNAAIFAGILLLVFTQNIPCYLLSGLLLGYSFGAIQPSLQTMALHAVAPERRGAANSTFFVSFDLGIAIGGFIAGLLAKHLGYDAMFLIVSVFSIISLVYYYKFARNHVSSLNPKTRMAKFKDLETTKDHTDVTHLPFVVTLSRQYGSGGHHVGELLSQKLNVKLYERDFIALTARQLGMSEEEVEANDQIVETRAAYDDPLQTSVFRTQSRIIKDLAQQDSCVIVGRLANHVLHGRPDCLHVFLYAPIEYRKQHAAATYGLDIEVAEANIRRSDKERSLHCLHYTGREWGDHRQYDLMVDTSQLGDEATADLLYHIVRERLRKRLQ